MEPNNYNRPHLERLFGKYKSINENVKYSAGLHSEVAALQQFLKKFNTLDVSGLTLFNVRLSKEGEPMPSAPCNNCSKLIETLNFKNIYST